jgi:hypothetical protein
VTTQVFLVALAVSWVVVLVPPLLRSRSFGRPSSSVGAFRQHLSSLQTAPKRRPVYGAAAPLRPVAGYRAPTSASVRPSRPASPLLRSNIQQRRQNVLVGLLAVATISLLGGLVLKTQMLLVVHGITDLLFAGYVYSLVQLRKSKRYVRYEMSRAA